MSIEWTGSGPEVLLHLDRDRSEGLRDQLEGQFRALIRGGRLTAGEQVPSSRALAQELGVSRGLVTECYAQLQAEGYLVTRIGSATRVGRAAHAPAPPPPRPADGPALRVDFKPGLPDLSSFPRDDWGRALRQACREIPTDQLGYGNAHGDPALREILAGYLRRVRGAAARPAHLVICAGYAQGLQLVLRALGGQGVRTVAVEDPGDPDQRTAAALVGLEVVGVPVDDGGIDTSALAATDARAVLLTPAHQTPTGGVLAPGRRRELVAWAADRDAFIVEDDYDAEFRYDREPVGALQGLAPDRVALLGSVSKSLTPALRLGWVLAPPELSAAVARHKDASDRGSPAIDQLALAHLIRSGRYDRHLRHMRLRYAGRRQALVGALRQQAPFLELGGLAAGFHAVARLPDGSDEQAVVLAARQRSVGLYGMSGYRLDAGTRPPQLVLGFGNLTESAITAGIATIADLLRSG